MEKIDVFKINSDDDDDFVKMFVTLSNAFWLEGWNSWPAASTHCLTATSSLSLIVRMYSSAFWLPPWWTHQQKKEQTINDYFSNKLKANEKN